MRIPTTKCSHKLDMKNEGEGGVEKGKEGEGDEIIRGWEVRFRMRQRERCVVKWKAHEVRNRESAEREKEEIVKKNVRKRNKGKSSRKDIKVK